MIPALFLALSPACAVEASDDQHLSNLVHQLRQFNDPAFYESDIVPAGAIPLITGLKDGLHRLADRESNRLGQSISSGEQIRRAMERRLLGQGVAVGYAQDAEPGLGYAYILEVRVDLPAGNSDMLAITYTMSIAYGADSSFDLYPREEGGWKMVFANESRRQGDINAAYGSFKNGLSAPDEDGRFRLVTAPNGPWPASIWHPIRFQVCEVESQGEHKASLSLSDSTEATATGEGYELRVERGRFDLLYTVVLFRPDLEWVKERLEYTLHGRNLKKRVSYPGD